MMTEARAARTCCTLSLVSSRMHGIMCVMTTSTDTRELNSVTWYGGCVREGLGEGERKNGGQDEGGGERKRERERERKEERGRK